MLETFPWKRFVFSSKKKDPIYPLCLIMIFKLNLKNGFASGGGIQPLCLPLLIEQDGLSSPLLLFEKDNKAYSPKQVSPIGFLIIEKLIERSQGNFLPCALMCCILQRRSVACDSYEFEEAAPIKSRKRRKWRLYRHCVVVDGEFRNERQSRVTEGHPRRGREALLYGHSE